MNPSYSSEHTLLIEIPRYPHSHEITQAFSAIEKYMKRTNNISSLPPAITRLTSLEHIRISSYITELPTILSQLTHLKLLDLTGCHHLFTIPDELHNMPGLKIKIGDIISRASEVVFIAVPGSGIKSSVFSVISSRSERKIEQVVIHQRHITRDYWKSK